MLQSGSYHMTESRPHCTLLNMLNFLEMTKSSGADLRFVRPKDHGSRDNPSTMNGLRLYAHKHQNFGLVRHSPNERRTTSHELRPAQSLTRPSPPTYDNC